MDSPTLREVAVQVCHYFRDFLESDFKRQQAPRRRVVLQTDSGLRCGMRLKPYPTLTSELWALLGRPSGEPLQMRIAARRHTRALSPVLRAVIAEQVQMIGAEEMRRVHEAVAACAAAGYAQAVSDPERWVEDVCTHLKAQVGDHVVRPLIARLDGPLQRSAYSIIDSLYSAESEMIDVVAADAAAKLPDVLAKHLARPDDAAVAGAMATFLTEESTRTALTAYFDGFVTADAFLELRDIETYATVTEGTQLYLYIGTCRFRNHQYPLFFVPVQIEKLDAGEGFELTLINQLFANRSAIDFVLQELAAARTREWASPIQERINYLDPQQSIYEVARGLFGMVATSMDLAGRIELSSRAAEASTAEVALTADLYLCAFERGEEALVNDYEELIALARQGGAPIVGLFEDLVRGVLQENPMSIAQRVESEWEQLPLIDRMVFDSPIPLNEEQRKTLLAVRNPEGRIVVVEGPPGTGKSHMITAIAADCAFNQKSCLVLSDKAEALQVVQDKLSEAMSRVRHVSDFPNPLLRLGRQDANFKRLVANQTVAQVVAYARATKANEAQLVAEKEDTAAALKGAIDTTVKTLGNVQLVRVQHLHRLEHQLQQALPELVGLLQVGAGKAEFDTAGTELATATAQVEAYLAALPPEALASVDALHTIIRRDIAAAEFAENHRLQLDALKAFTHLEPAHLPELATLVLQFRQLRMPLFGYLFQGSKVAQLDRQVNQLPAARVLQLKKDADALEAAVACGKLLEGRLQEKGLLDGFAAVYRQLRRDEPPRPEGPTLARRALLALEGCPGAPQLLLSQPAATWRLALEYRAAWREVQSAFDAAPHFDYVGTKTKLERLNTSMMNAHVDSQLVNFVEHHRADAKTLAQLIAQRQKFPEEKFDAVRKSFPITIASIREFGEYMPLAPELFDVVVIDEASQVSVAQALPALLRARKIVVLGDSKQFSNVKSANASISTNDKYRANLVQFFERNVRADAEALQRLAMFDVKRSILEFCSLAASYTIMLRKHFRSYPELIGYSSATFYSHQLQAIKVRGVPLGEVIRFDMVSTEGHAATRTTNTAEADFIAAKLEELLELEDPPSVGVITPFREQHTLLTKRLYGHAKARAFEDQLRLKVMTFDSCQGEERQVIFYSMVASEGKDALSYIFPVALDNAAESVEDKLKVQRLNVGFSRAQECIWFVHSMPLANFRGSIAGALQHYATALHAKHGHAKQTDASSPMEAKVLGWLQATQFVQAQPEQVDILPQFPIGEYLKQLDPTYSHPSWRVDFLLTYRSAKGTLHFVIEYDGFEYHFQPGADVHVGNHERYLLPQDVERQLTLESYGYRFLRINRFNVGADPVRTLDERLLKLVELATGEQSAKIVERLQAQAEGMLKKDMKQCTRCTQIKPLQGFYDAQLKGGAGGYGRVCASCKGAPAGGRVRGAMARPAAT